MGKGFDRHFSRDNMQLASRHTKRRSTSLVTRENSNQNRNEVARHTCLDGRNQRSGNEQVWDVALPVTSSSSELSEVFRREDMAACTWSELE